MPSKLRPRAEAGLVCVALAASFVSFQGWGPVAGLSAALVAGLVGHRRSLPPPLVLAASAAAGSAFVHFAVAPEHFDEWWGFGLFFVLAAEAQLGWALVLGRARNAPILVAGVVGSLLLVATWALSRTAGLPFGPEAGAPEPVGVSDVVSVVLELVTAGACLSALRIPDGRRAPGGIPIRAVGVAGCVALTAVGLAALPAA